MPKIFFYVRTLIFLFIWGVECYSSSLVASPIMGGKELSGATFTDPIYLLFFLILIALIPLVLVLMTSFTKIIVVLSITRLALGTSQSPPNIVVMSLAILLTCFAMYPVSQQIYSALSPEFTKKTSFDALSELVDVAKAPMRDFLRRHAKTEDVNLFFDLMNKEPQPSAQTSSEDFIILVPAFLISELTKAFQIGFLIYLPFLVIDMTVANLLMALGMQMLSPTTISLPFKILLFVLVDGWRLLAEGLVKG